jgi:hypothetical protein
MKRYTIKPLLAILALFIVHLSFAQRIVDVLASGTADDITTINNALTSGNGVKTVVRLLPNGTNKVFKISQYLNFPDSNTTLWADTNLVSVKPTFTTGSGAMVRGTGKLLHSATGLSISMDTAKSYFRYTAASGFQIQPGNVVKLLGPDYSASSASYNYAHGYVGRCIRIHNDTVFLNHAIKDNSYKANAISVYDPLRNIHIIGVRFDFTTVTGINAMDFRSGIANLSVEGCAIMGMPNTTDGMMQGITTHEADSVTIKNNSISNQRPLYGNSSYYALNLSGYNHLVLHNHFMHCNDPIESGGVDVINQETNVIHNDIDESEHVSLGFHGNTMGRIAYNNINARVTNSLQPRHWYTRVDHNRVKLDAGTNNYQKAMFFMENAYHDIQIDSNIIIMLNGVSGSNNYGFYFGGSLQGATYNIKSFDNNIYGASLTFESIGSYTNVTSTRDTLFNYNGKTGSFQPSSATGITYTARGIVTTASTPPGKITVCPYDAAPPPPPPPPVVKAAAGTDTVYYKNQTRPDTIFLDGSKSTGATAYQWTQISGPTTLTTFNGTQVKAFAKGTLTNNGTYKFQLSVNAGVAKDTIVVFVRDWQKKNQVACRTGFDTTAKTGGLKFMINPTESKNSGASVGWNVPYLNRDNFVSGHGYAGQSIKGGDTLVFQTTADSVYLFNFGDVGGDQGCPVIVIPGTKPLVFRSGKFVVGQDQQADTNVVNHVIFDGTALRGSGIAYGFQTNNVTPDRSPIYNSFGGGWITDFTFKGFWNRKVATMQIKLDGDSVLPWKGYDKFVQNNITLSDFIIDGSSGEAMYIGNTDPNGTKDYNGITPPQRMNTVTVQNGIIMNSQYDGVQLSNARNNALVQNVLVYNAGTLNTANQRTAIELGGNTQGSARRNIILRATGQGIDNYGFGDGTDYQNVIDSVYNGTVDLSASSGIYTRSIPSTVDYETKDSALKLAINNNLIARVYAVKRYARTSNNTGDKVQRIGTITNNLFVNDTATVVSSVIDNVAKYTVSGNTLQAKFPVRFYGYTVTPTGYQIAIGQNDSTNTFTSVDDAVSWLFYRSSVSQPGNTSPSANAGPVVFTNLPKDSAVLSGSGSDQESAVTYAWTKVSGPNTPVIVKPTAASTTVRGLVEGTYVFRLTVADLNGATATDTTSLIVGPNLTGNIAPVAIAGADQVINWPTNAVNITGSGTDQDGTISSYGWTQVSGPATAGITKGTAGAVTFTFPSTGVWVFRLTVVDNSGAPGTDDVQVTVSGPSTNTAPNITLTSPKNGSQYITGGNISLSASVTDQENDVTRVEFYRDATKLATITTSPYTYTWTTVPAGTYSIMAKAYDAGGNVTPSAAATINVGSTPSVRLTAPVNNAKYRKSQSIPIAATASDADGNATITKVEFYNGSTLLFTDTTAPYSYSWSTDITGNKTLSAKAYDNTGRVGTSSTVTIRVR